MASSHTHFCLKKQRFWFQKTSLHGKEYKYQRIVMLIVENGVGNQIPLPLPLSQPLDIDNCLQAWHSSLLYFTLAWPQLQKHNTSLQCTSPWNAASFHKILQCNASLLSSTKYSNAMLMLNRFTFVSHKILQCNANAQPLHFCLPQNTPMQC